MGKLSLQREHLRLIEQNFNLLDVDRDGKITKREAGLLFRSLGQTVSNKRLEKILSAHFQPASQHDFKKVTRNPSSSQEKVPPGKEPTQVETSEPTIDFSSFMQLFEDAYQQPLSVDIVIQSLQLFDPERTGHLSLTRLRDILSYSDAEPLRGDDLEDIMRLAETLAVPDGPSNRVDYVAFAKKLTQGCGVKLTS